MKAKPSKQIVFLVLAGLMLGCMIGMSSSPVISVVISSLLTTIITVSSVLGRYFTSNEGKIFRKISVVPIASFIIAIGLGTVPGIFIRTSNILDLGSYRQEKELRHEIELFTKYGLDSADVVRRIFESKYPPSGVNSELRGSLYSWRALKECEVLCMKDTSDIDRALERSNDFRLKRLRSIKNKVEIIDSIKIICGCKY